jgi:hypothetical protein
MQVLWCRQKCRLFHAKLQVFWHWIIFILKI